jgi:hypothetical protein
MYSAIVDSIFYECDFCKVQGVLGKSILNKDGWYFCGPCLRGIEGELEKQKQTSLFDQPLN